MPKHTYIVRAVTVNGTERRVIWSSDHQNEVYTNKVDARRRGKWIKHVFEDLNDYPFKLYMTIHKRACNQCGATRRGRVRFFEESDTEDFVDAWS